jgi:vacuole morphology and inheritance protein 14
VLPALSNEVEQVRQAANRVNSALMEYIMSLPDDTNKPPAQALLSGNGGGVDRRDTFASVKSSKTTSREQVTDSKTTTSLLSMLQPDATPQTSSVNPTPSSPPATELDYEAAVNALTLQFLHEFEATRVAALAWLIMLHRKAPRKILAINDGTFPALLKTLSDPSDSVVTRDLVLLSQISKNSDDSYFTSFMVNLLKLFCTDRKLLETRGNLIIRQLCVSLSSERIYRVMADCLEKDEDVEFVSIMVQNLNNNLIAAPEMADLRRRLRSLDTRVVPNLYPLFCTS